MNRYYFTMEIFKLKVFFRRSFVWRYAWLLLFIWTRVTMGRFYMFTLSSLLIFLFSLLFHWIVAEYGRIQSP